MCKCSETSSPFEARSFVHASIAAARASPTWTVVQTRGFHMIVIGTPKPSAIAAVFASSLSAEASPSKSSVHTTYSGAESLNSCVATTVSPPASRSTMSIA